MSSINYTDLIGRPISFTGLVGIPVPFFCYLGKRRGTIKDITTSFGNVRILIGEVEYEKFFGNGWKPFGEDVTWEAAEAALEFSRLNTSLSIHQFGRMPLYIELPKERYRAIA